MFYALMEFIVFSVILEVIQAVGWATLKIVTLGAYGRRSQFDHLLEGTMGFGVIIAVTWTAFRWMA